MAFNYYFPSLLLLVISSSSLLCFSLSTISISNTSNQTLVCALTNTSHLQCTSLQNPIPFSLTGTLQTRRFSGVVSGNGFVCGLRSPLGSNTSTILCWRFSNNGDNMTYKRIYKGPELKELEASTSRICGVEKVTNLTRCWTPVSFPLSGNYDSIAIGEDFLCGLSKPPGRITCGGNIANAPSGDSFITVTSRSRQACAITVDNDVTCWGEKSTSPPSEKFSAISLGENGICGVRWLNKTVTCWGSNNNNNGFTLPKSLEKIHFISIYANGLIFCGVVTSNYTLYCWGDDQSVFTPFQDQPLLPGPCRHDCLYGPLPGSVSLCGNGLMICDSINTHNPKLPVPDTPRGQQETKDKTWSNKNIAFLVVGCVGTCSLLLVIGFLIYKSHFRCRVHDSGRLDDNRIIVSQPKLEKRLSSLASLGNHGQLVEFSIEELAHATEGFSPRFQLGIGSFGIVYKAVLSDGRHVAIKRADLTNPTLSGITRHRNRREDNDSAFVNELESMSRLNHKNLVKLLGFYDDAEERVLVYEYMPNGSLSDHLHNPRFEPLTWERRLTIALDAARGIQYLHDFAVPPVIHRDIKSSNILLDATWTAKVSDFGLSQMGPTEEEDVSHLSLRAAGTLGYIDPEYYRLQQLTTKSDVYSFGVVLLELLSGHKAIHMNEEENPRNVVEFVVPYVLQDEVHRALDRRIPPPTPYEIESVAHLGYLAVECVVPCGRERPSMAEVVSNLEKALAACLAAPQTESLSRSDSN